jgi:PPP4R2
MKKMLIERLESFSAAPFTIQRISELLSEPRKQYSRIDKFMRAVEKNILVVSTVSPGRHREESENGDSLDSALNGDFSSEVNVDIDMENDGSFTMTKEFNVTTHRKEATHDILTVSHDTVTIKKVASKEEASTSAVACEKNGEPLQGTETDIKIDSEAAIVITINSDVAVAESNSELSPQKLDEHPELVEVEAKVHEEEETEISDKVDIPQEPIIAEISDVNYLIITLFFKL